MATLDFVQTNFTRGELSPRLRGRIDFQGFFNGVERLNNFTVLPLGGIMKRPGTRFVAEVENSEVPSRLIPFEFNVDQSFALEFGENVIRFFADGGVVVANEVTTAITNGEFDSGSTGWTDASNGTGSVTFGTFGGEPAAKLTAAGDGNEAILRQEISIPSGDEDTIHSLLLRIGEVDGTRNLQVRVRAGTTAGGNDIFERVVALGAHIVDIDPGGSSTVWLDFVSADDTSIVGEPAVLQADFLTGGPLVLPSPYSSLDTSFLNWTQSADVLFLVHPSFAPRELRRFGPAQFSLVPFDFRDGPYQEVNLTTTTLQPDAISGRVTVTASSTDGINAGAGFAADDKGRLIRIQTTETADIKFPGDGSQVEFDFPFFVPDTESIRVTLTNTGSGTIQNIAEGSTVDAFESTDFEVTLNNPEAGGTVDFSISKAPATDIEVTILRDIVFWGWGEIVKVNNPTEIELLVRGDSGLGSATATRNWRLGDWSQARGWPQTATFHNERLTFGGSDAQAQTVWFSQTADFNSFSPSTTDATVNDDNAISVTLATSQVNFIRWMESINSGLAVGTSGAEFLIRSATTTQPLAPTSIEAVRQTTRGSAAFVPPARVGLSSIFVQRGNATVRELAFDFNVDGLVARDFSLVSEHLLKPGIGRVDYQQNPDSIVWMLRADQRLIGFTLEGDQEVFAWHGHTIGGTFDGSDAAVESISITTEGGDDRLWLVVKRTIGGVTRRYIEFMEQPWDFTLQPVEDIFFVDSGLTGTFDPPAVEVSGLGHLEGETVQIVADGAPRPPQVVENGIVTLDTPASVVHVGLGYTAEVQTFPLDEGIRGQISRGKVKRISQVHLLFHETVGALFGRETLDRMPFRDSSMAMDQPIPPFTGTKSFRMPMRHDTEGWVRVESDQPLPATVLNITAEMEFFDT